MAATNVNIDELKNQLQGKNAESLEEAVSVRGYEALAKVLNENKIGGRDLKTLLIRANRQGETAWQLYVKEKNILTNKLKNGCTKINILKE